MTEPEPLVDQVIRAHNEIVRLCTTREGWRMSVPANPMRDSDLILSDALTSLDAALAAAVERATRAEAERDEARDARVAIWGVLQMTRARADTAEAQLAKVRVLVQIAKVRAESSPSRTFGGHPFPASVHVTELDAALGSVGATEGEAGHEFADEQCPDGCTCKWCTRHAPASPAAEEPERRLCAGTNGRHGYGFCTPADPTRADEPRACPRPEAHHYQPGTKP